MLEETNLIIRSFQRPGLSLKPDGSQDSELMAFQGQERGVPPYVSHAPVRGAPGRPAGHEIRGAPERPEYGYLRI